MSENHTDADDRDAPTDAAEAALATATDDELAEREPDRPAITFSRGPGDRADDVEGDELTESAARVAAAWDDVEEGER